MIGYNSKEKGVISLREITEEHGKAEVMNDNKGAMSEIQEEMTLKDKMEVEGIIGIMMVEDTMIEGGTRVKNPAIAEDITLKGQDGMKGVITIDHITANGLPIITIEGRKTRKARLSP